MVGEYKENVISKQIRDSTVDIIKGLGIICMVAGHCGSPITKFVYLFHMAIFFIASGYCYKSKHSDTYTSVFGFIKRKFITLWFPYVLWIAIYSILHNFFILINVYTNNPLLLESVNGNDIVITEYWTLMDVIKNIIKACLLHGGTEMGAAFWFIATLMEISVVYCILDFGIKKVLKRDNTILVQGCFSVVFLILGYGCYLMGHSFWGIDRILSYYILFYGGYVLKQYAISCKERKLSIHMLIFIISFIVLLICNEIGMISLNENYYENPLYLLIVSFMGWQFLYEIAFFISKCSVIKNLMICVGQNTMAVVILHLLCFKIVSYIGVLLQGEPLYLVAAFPVLYKDGCWWIAYLAVGLIVPISCSLLWKWLRRNLSHIEG